MEKPPIATWQSVALTGVVRGESTIELDEGSCIPDGTRVRVLVFVQPAEGKAPHGNEPETEDEAFAALEEILSWSRGRPIKITTAQ